MKDSSVSQAGVRGCSVYKETSVTGKRIMDNLAVAYTINNVVFSELMRSTVTPTATEVVSSIPTTVTTTDVGTGMSSVEGVSEDDIDTMIEEGIGLPDLFNDNAIADSANSTSDSRFVPLVGPLWEYGRETCSGTTVSERRVPGTNRWDWVLIEPPSAVAVSNHIRR